MMRMKSALTQCTFALDHCARTQLHLVGTHRFGTPGRSLDPYGLPANGVWPTSGTLPRPFAVSGVMVIAPTMTQIVPMYRRMKPSQRTTWTQMSAILPDGSHFTFR